MLTFSVLYNAAHRLYALESANAREYISFFNCESRYNMVEIVKQKLVLVK